jgi:hypothetical protein
LEVRAGSQLYQAIGEGHGRLARQRLGSSALENRRLRLRSRRLGVARGNEPEKHEA